MSVRPAVHRTILVVDVAGYGQRTRTRSHLAIRDGLYRALREAFIEADIPWDACDREDRGDGALLLAPPEVPKSVFVEPLPHAIVDALRDHNRTHPADERIRLRMALHAGEIHYDAHGVTAASINFAFRLLDAAPLKAALADSPGVLGLIVSPWFYDEVVRHSAENAADSYRPVSVTVKETTTTAWVALPDHPYPPGEVAVPAESVIRVPRQLPAHTPHFVGRPEELRELAATPDKTGTVIIWAKDGSPGVGKTALALHWAHQVADQWPDGQLYVNLRGFDPGERPMDPAEAIRGFLDALDVPPEHRPADTTTQADLYRSLVRKKRILVVLDNARDAEHVRPLLPGNSRCMVVVTSRNRLAELVAGENAKPIALDVLSQPEATSLLARYLGRERVTAEPTAVARIIENCARLPLALRIAAARVAGHPQAALSELAGQLTDEVSRTGHGTRGPDRAEVRAVILWAYRAVTPAAARLFRVIGPHSGPDFGVLDAARLAGLPASGTRALLDELTRAHLLDEHVPGRYRFHDLIRAFAIEQGAIEQDTSETRQ